MALSASTNISYTAGDIINSALQTIRVVASGESATAAETNDALAMLEKLLKHWGPKGLKRFLKKNKSMALTAATASYTLGPSGTITMDRPIAVHSIYRRDSNSYDQTLTPMSREEYRELSDKTSTGAPTQYFYDPTLTNGTLYVWPVPTAADATEYTLELNYRKQVDDADATTNDIEIPQEWYLAAVFGLAALLIPSYDVPDRTANRVERYAEKYLAEAEASDIEFDTSIFFQPAPRYK